MTKTLPLEEVLPEMRKGRVASAGLRRFRVHDGRIQVQPDGTHSGWMYLDLEGCEYVAPLDGWSLEPERVQVHRRADEAPCMGRLTVFEEEYRALIRLAELAEAERETCEAWERTDEIDSPGYDRMLEARNAYREHSATIELVP